MKKSVWITILEKNEGLGKTIYQEMNRYGLEPGGHFWEDDLAGMAWAGVIPELVSDNCRCWIIVGQTESLDKKSIRQGLSLLALSAQAEHGHNFPIIISPSGRNLESSSLPTPLGNAEIVKTGLGVRAVARANAPLSQSQPDYRLNVHPLPGLGLWFETGPARDPWHGAFMGFAGEGAPVPDAHGVGSAGTIPRTSTLRYPVQGLKMELNDVEFTAWGVHNEISPADSYYIRVTAPPETLLFGPFPEEKESRVLTLYLA